MMRPTPASASRAKDHRFSGQTAFCRGGIVKLGRFEWEAKGHGGGRGAECEAKALRLTMYIIRRRGDGRPSPCRAENPI
jgi:hypothetical protein